jgi:hypothetical protein
MFEWWIVFPIQGRKGDLILLYREEWEYEREYKKEYVPWEYLTKVFLDKDWNVFKIDIKNLKGRDINDTIEHWNNKVKGFWLLIIFKWSTKLKRVYVYFVGHKYFVFL